MAPRIDDETKRRILDAADIVDVVSDFVSLKRNGSSFIGLCPFHNDRRPSMRVTRSKQIYKCFACGKGGGPVDFVMEHEKMTYPEAMRYLAKKYHIELKERELTSAEIQAENDRQAMLKVNDWALSYFEHNLMDTVQGRNVGLAYFRERGLDELTIKKFHLGYALEERDALLLAATQEGYKEHYLVRTGLITKNEQGRTSDRFRGRVIFPIFSVSGTVVGFGGRILSSEKKLAKYVNSPESEVYNKRRELYGLSQARKAIEKAGKCILVEGYMDVISMSRSGVENVVASSGTALTNEQIALLQRYTRDIIVIYDTDAAGIKASLRGVDMLLSKGMNVKVVQFPDGEDPDSYARSHSSSELEAYLAENEEDFIAFKIRILMEGTDRDPMARARAITDIVRSVSVIPDDICRSVFIGEVARRMQMDEQVVSLTVAKQRAEAAKANREERQRQYENKHLDVAERQDAVAPTPTAIAAEKTKPQDASSRLRPLELEVIRYVLRYGYLPFCQSVDADGNPSEWISVYDYVVYDLSQDDISFRNPEMTLAMERVGELRSRWEAERPSRIAEVEQEITQIKAEGLKKIADEAFTPADIHAREQALEEKLEQQRREMIEQLDSDFIGAVLLNDPDDKLRSLVADVVIDRWTLSKIHTKHAHVETERERLDTLLPRALYELKDGIIESRCADLRQRLSSPENDEETVMTLMEELAQYNEARMQLAKLIGDRIIVPRR